MTDPRTAAPSTEVAGITTALAAVAAILLGSFLVYGVGFASPTTIHNAAHDGRHSFAFPCH
jgi:cobalt transporter subunit CbtB